MSVHMVCNRCGAVFTEDEAKTENFLHTEIQPMTAETFLACPHCLSENIEDAAYCYRCKQPVRYSDLKGGYYCGECIADMKDRATVSRYIAENIDDFAEWLHEKRMVSNEDEKDQKDRT